MDLLDNDLYLQDIRYVSGLNLPWSKLQGSSLLISGATGMIGSFLVDVVMYRNAHCDMQCDVYAMGRSAEKAKLRFGEYWNDSRFHFVEHDINSPIAAGTLNHAGYAIHLASATHPMAYASDPIGTVTTNVFGLYNMLEFAVRCSLKRVAFASSVEIYGENRGDVEKFGEDYCGYIDCNTMRAGYPESKRCGEALCQAYIKQKGLNVVIPRLARTYGPTLLQSDTKALSQFLHKALAGENIVLKSEGNQYYSYTYVADAVSGLLTVLLCGECGGAYNIADSHGDIRLKDLAALIAEAAGRKVVFELPDQVEKAGYSKATKARLDGTKLKKLGWTMCYDIKGGVARTLKILKSLGD